MGNQRLIQTQTATTDRKQHVDKRIQQPEHPIQEVLGSRAASRHFRKLLQRPQAEGTSGPNPLHSVLQSISPISPRAIQAKPIFRGLSHELTPALDSRGTVIQAKMTIGAPGDQYEQEADRVAEQVVQKMQAPSAQESMLGEPLQRQKREEDGHALMMKPLAQRPAVGGMAATQDLESSINRARGSGQPLDAGLHRNLGQAMGADFSGVRVHTDHQADQLNRSIQAKAFTTGQDVFFRQGVYQPGSRKGQELIAHELAHVVQQGGSQSVKRAPESVIQREWDLDAYKKDHESEYAALLAKMEGLTPAIGRSRLEKLASKTDNPEQLSFLLQMGTLKLEDYLKSFDAATLHNLMRVIGKTEFFSVVDNLVKFKVDIKDYLAKNPQEKLPGIKAQILSAKSTAGLISANGDEIAFTTVTAVVGDGTSNEKTAVEEAVQAMDRGTLVGSPYGNGEGNLPGTRGAGGYTEYDVTPRTRDRGRRRLVVHDTKGFVYYTWNHYGNDGTTLPAFKRIR
jgi:guanyl-specific ribonuclease Sa